MYGICPNGRETFVLNLHLVHRRIKILGNRRLARPYVCNQNPGGGRSHGADILANM